MRCFIFSMLFIIPLALHGATIMVLPGTNTLQPAVSLANPNDTLVLMSGGNYVLDSIGGAVLVNKPLTIKGEDLSALVSTNDNALTNMFNISSSDVTITNFSVEHGNQTSSISTVFAITSAGLNNITINSMLIKYAEIGISSITSTITVENNYFESISLPSNDHRAIILDGTVGFSLIKNNTFNSQSSAALNRGTIFILLTSNNISRTATGTLTIEGNTLLPGQDPIKQFFVMEAFNGPAEGFALNATGNDFAASRGSFIFFSTQDKPADIFSSVMMKNNIDKSNPSTGYKGLIGFDGILFAPPKFDVATNPHSIFFFSGNILTVNAITAIPWAPMAPGGVFGVNTDVYNVSFFSPPPISSEISVQQIVECYPTQEDVINVIRWINPIEGIQSFNVYKNSPSNLIANIPAESVYNFYLDHRQKKRKPVTYYLRSVSNGVAGSLTAVTLNFAQGFH